MRLLLLLFAALVVVIAARTASERRAGASNSFVPLRDDAVLEKVERRTGNADHVARRAALAKEPSDPAVAAGVARAELDEAGRTSDPRHLGHAQAALAPWWSAGDAPAEVLYLRALIRQRRHDFVPALADLTRLVALRPEDAQAWLVLSVVQAVRGDYRAATQSCEALRPLVEPIIAATCAANVQSLSADPRAASLALSTALGAGQPPAELRGWVLSTQGEIAARAGDAKAAERHFRSAVASDPGDAYALGAYADFLLDQRRPAEAARLAKTLLAEDAMLLRLAIAQARQNDPAAKATGEELRGRFVAGHARGDFVHQREEARFELEVCNNAARALELAVTNWAVQKEEWDARILLASAQRAGKPAEGAEARAALARLFDPAVLELLAKEAR